MPRKSAPRSFSPPTFTTITVSNSFFGSVTSKLA